MDLSSVEHNIHERFHGIIYTYIHTCAYSHSINTHIYIHVHIVIDIYKRFGFDIFFILIRQ